MRATAPLISAKPAINSRSMGWPEIGKFSTARWVCARHLAVAGTLTSPIESFSTRYSTSLMSTSPCSIPLRRILPVAGMALLLGVLLSALAIALGKLSGCQCVLRVAVGSAVAERARSLLGGVVDRDGDDRSAVRAQLARPLPECRGVE